MPLHTRKARLATEKNEHHYSVSEVIYAFLTLYNTSLSNFKYANKMK